MCRIAQPHPEGRVNKTGPDLENTGSQKVRALSMTSLKLPVLTIRMLHTALKHNSWEAMLQEAHQVEGNAV